MTKSLSHSIPLFVLLSIVLLGCREQKEPGSIESTDRESTIVHAQGFSIQQNDGLTTLEVDTPWPGSQKSFKYLLVPKDRLATMRFAADAYDAVVGVPVKKMILTSTTHIPALEALGELEVLVGFPNTDMISSPQARKLVDLGQIRDLGVNEGINTEVALSREPEVVMGFGINDTNRTYETLEQAGIAVVYNGDWVEQTPLGKAEWIKFFAPFFQKEEEADRIFSEIEMAYSQARKLTQKARHRPTVLTGGLYRDVWHVAGGKSWLAHFLKDANAHYLWEDRPETGGIALGLEAVLDQARDAEFWLNPSYHTSYGDLEAANPHYRQFEAFDKRNIYSNAIEKGEKGGVLFYELAPQRPDLVLGDLIHILHPGLLPDHELRFFKPLE